MRLQIILLVLLTIGFAVALTASALLATPPGMSVATQTNFEIPPQYQGNLLVLPIRAHLIVDDSGFYTSYREKGEIIRLLDDINRIWAPAGIAFYIEDIQTTELAFEAIPNALNRNYDTLLANEHHHPQFINIYFAQSLNNINGLAIPQSNSILIADQTTNNDFRVIAHELGHLLDLRHVDPRTRLMSRGFNGETITSWEIEVARSATQERLN